MNYKHHLTHYKGKAIKDLSRDEALEMAWDFRALYHNCLGDRAERINSSGKGLVEVFG